MRAGEKHGEGNDSTAVIITPAAGSGRTLPEVPPAREGGRRCGCQG